MRALAAGAIGLALVAGCGRIGYEPLDTDGDGGVVIDAPDASDGFLDTPCEQAVLIADLGAPATTPPSRFAIDVAVTGTGLVAVYQLGDGEIHATGVAVDGTGRVANLQTRGHVLDSMTSDFSAAALGDRVVLGVDDPDNGRIAFLDLSEYGYSNGPTSYVDLKRARGHAFVTADPTNDQLVVVGVNGTSSWRFTVDHYGDLIEGPMSVITGGSLEPESVGAVPHGIGYNVFAGTTSECTIAPYNEAWVPTGTPRTVAMTCHHLGLASAPGSSNIVAGWNCDNEQVWVTAGDVVVAPLPAEQSIFGGSGTVASAPRVAATPDGVWYAYAVAGGRLGRALLDSTGAPVSGVAPGDVYSSSRVVAHDLVSRDGKAFLVWIESGAPADELKLMRLCTP